MNASASPLILEMVTLPRVSIRSVSQRIPPGSLAGVLSLWKFNLADLSIGSPFFYGLLTRIFGKRFSKRKITDGESVYGVIVDDLRSVG